MVPHGSAVVWSVNGGVFSLLAWFCEEGRVLIYTLGLDPCARQEGSRCQLEAGIVLHLDTLGIEQGTARVVGTLLLQWERRVIAQACQR